MAVLHLFAKQNILFYPSNLCHLCSIYFSAKQNITKNIIMKTAILAIGRNEEILQILVRLVNKNEDWNATGALTDEEAMQVCDTLQPRIVLLSNGIGEDSEKKLRGYFSSKNPAVIIIQHYGGGSGLLNNEILQALGS